MASNYEHDPVIGEYQHDAHRPRAAEALQSLRKIASLVKPIMRQRSWHVGILQEFFPPEQNLLGLNHDHGRKICLRLRYAGDERQLLPLEQVVDTMLHELCHIVRGPHDEIFHNLWNTLRDEHEALIRKGYTGEGFLSTGRKLGGRSIPRDEARRLARAQAEKRRTLTAGSGQKLGGAPVRRGEDIRKVIANAATRRKTVEQGCGSNVTTKEREREIIEQTNRSGTRTRAEPIDLDEETMMIAYIDLVQEEEREKYGKDYVPPSKENPAGSQGRTRPSKTGLLEEQRRIEAEARRGSTPTRTKAESPNSQPPPVPSSTKPRSPGSSNPSPRHSTPNGKTLGVKTEPIEAASIKPSFKDDWECSICTLVNPATYLVCDACQTERPSPPASPIPAFTTPTTNSQRASIRDGNEKKAVRSLMNLDKTTERKEQKPIGWTCHMCGNFMEEQWWTCARCHAMKLSS